MKFVFEFLITSSALILAVLLIRAACRKRVSRRFVYAMWLVVLIKLLLPLPVAGSAVSVMNFVPELPRASSGTVEILPGSAPEQQSVLPPLPEGQTDVPSGSGGVYALPDAAPDASAEPFRLDAAVVLYCVWGAGSAVFAAVFIASNARFGRKLRSSRRPFDAPESVRFGSRTPVYVADGISSPCLYGLVRPAVYITPETAEDGTALRSVLAHELSHRRHLDHIWGALRCVLLTVWWWHPLVWAAAYLSRGDAELACDESAIAMLGEENRLAYGRTLVAMAARRCGAPSLTLASTPMNTGKSLLKKRILAAVKPGMTAVWAALALIAAMLLCTACTFTGAKNGGYREHIVAECSVESISEGKDGLTARMRLEGMEEERSFRLSQECGEAFAEQADACGEITAAKLRVEISRLEYLLMTRAERELLEDDLYAALKQTDRFDRYVTVSQMFPALGDTVFSGVYKTAECVYVDPLSSYYPYAEDGPFYCFSSGGMYIYDRINGDVAGIYPVDLSDPDSYDEIDPGEWSGRFSEGADIADISGCEVRREYRLSDTDRLYLIDGQLLYAKLMNSGDCLYLVKLGTASDEETLEMCVTAAMLERAGARGFAANLPEGMTGAVLPETGGGLHYDYAAEVHDILGTTHSGSTVTVYLNAAIERFCYDEAGEPVVVGGEQMPAALTFERVNGNYYLNEFWTPSDGSEYAGSIKEKFPAGIWKAAMDPENHSAELYQLARSFGGRYDPDMTVRELIYELSEQKKLDRGSGEYKTLIGMDIHTLRVCAARFEESGQTGQRALVMESLCRELLGEEDIKLEAEPQEWYDAFIEYALRMREITLEEDMAKFYPRTLELLRLHDEYSK